MEGNQKKHYMIGEGQDLWSDLHITPPWMTLRGLMLRCTVTENIHVPTKGVGGGEGSRMPKFLKEIMKLKCKLQRGRGFQTKKTFHG